MSVGGTCSRATIIYDYISSHVFNSWQCYEFRFTYAGYLVGVSTVAWSHG